MNLPRFPSFSLFKSLHRTQRLNSCTRWTGQTRVTNSQAPASESWLVRCSPCTSGFNQSNPHDINHGSLTILLPWGLPDRHVPFLANYTPNSAFPVSLSPTDFHRDITKNYHPTTTVHQEEPSPPSPLLEIAPLFPSHSILPRSHPKGTCSFNRPRCSSLNGIKASTELLVKNFFFRLSPLFSSCEPPNYNPPKRYITITITLHPPPPPRHKARKHTDLSVSN